jgi:hypothetical protein
VLGKVLSKGVCECGHLLSDHHHIGMTVFGEPQAPGACGVRNRNFNPCACRAFREDFGGEWVGNEASRAGFL